jgi:glyoxylase-like metal-dependent hydrolase (beta-lactamase superfamily II)
MSGVLRGAITKGGFGPEKIADGLWRVQGNPARMNVYLIEDEGELVMYDAGGRCMAQQLKDAISQIGLPLREIVLGHGHTDHRGAAPFMGVPVRCHADEVRDAEGTGGFRYWRFDKLSPASRHLHHDVLHPRFWDGGPVKIDSTISEGDVVAGFEVMHIPGHAPGLIALVRSDDGVALTSDAFYTLDNRARDDVPHTPLAAYNLDTSQARASLRALAERDDLKVCWPGHAEPIRGDVSAQLIAAANR